MTDRTETILAQARTDALRDVRPPGVEQIRHTVRRRRGIRAGVGAAAAIAALSSGLALAGAQPGVPAARPRASQPQPTPTQNPNLGQAEAALGDPQQQPWVMATAGVVSRDYENDVNDIPAGDYDLSVYCAGAGSVDVKVNGGSHGGPKLAAGTVACSASPVPGLLSVRQPVDGYLQVLLSGDARASAGAGFSFKFVRRPVPAVKPGPQTTANARTAVQLLSGPGLPQPQRVTSEADKTVEVRRDSGKYLISYACAGPGTLRFELRTAALLRDGTVATTGRIELTAGRPCTTAGYVRRDVPVSLPPGSAFTVTTTAEGAARDHAGGAYTIRPA